VCLVEGCRLRVLVLLFVVVVVVVPFFMWL